MRLILVFIFFCALIVCITGQYSKRDYAKTQKGSKKYCKKNDIEVEVNKIISFNNPCAQYECLPDYTLRETQCQNVKPQNLKRFPECCADHDK
ncbi:unnamed protein product [Chironomus riparius]|uniref:Single domain-containing protein n=1 Tax=Chironomus riparius TaxID=315576 RepID=A0A9N9WUG6_9DIPT|nr:unnamed protein product [Chironomus riparius]